MACHHKWGPYTELPGGEDPLVFRQCTKCRAIGRIGYGNTMHDARFLQEHRPRVHVLHCVTKGCGRIATGRRYGRSPQGARVLWACSDHAEDLSRRAVAS